MFNRYCPVLMLFGMVFAAGAEAADPAKLGPYPVGVRTEVFVDKSRIDPVTEKPRTLVTDVWYPAVDSANDKRPTTFASFFVSKEGVAAAAGIITGFGGNFFTLNRNFKTLARRNAKFRDGRFPLLIFSHGNGGLRHQNAYQCDYLASHGYIIAAPDHTGNAALTVLPDQIVPYDGVTRSSERRDDRPKDCTFLITQLWKLAQSKDHWLRDAFVPNKVGAFGHSFGGFTVCRLAELDPRVQAIIPMTLAVTTANIFENVDAKPVSCRIPSMVLLGDADRTVKQRGNDASTAWFKATAASSYLLVFKDAGHFTFTEMSQINPGFGDGIGDEKDDEGNVTFKFSDPNVDQNITNQYSVAFFDRYVKGIASADNFLKKNHFPDRLVYERHDGRKSE